MNADRLRIDFADLADQVTSVDLRDRVLATSRRLAIRRAVAASAAVVAVLAAASGIALAVLPIRNGPPGPPAATNPPVVTPSPTPVTASGIDGTAYYVGVTSNASVVHAVRGATDTAVATVPWGAGECVANTLTVAPDGRHLAWVRGGDPSGQKGMLVVAAIDGSQQREVTADISCLGSTPIAWAGPNRAMVREGNRSVLIDVIAGTPVPSDPGQETLRAWSADGKYLAAVSEGQPVVAAYEGDNRQPRQYTYQPPADQAANYDGWSARSVSNDGRYVSVGWIGTDPSRRVDSFAVVDTVDSSVVNLPVSGPIDNILFLSDGHVLVRQAAQLTLLDADFKVLDRGTVPATVQGILLTYVP